MKPPIHAVAAVLWLTACGSSNPPPEGVETETFEGPFDLVDRGDSLYLRTSSDVFRIVAEDGGAKLTAVDEVPVWTDTDFEALLPDSVPAFGEVVERAWLSQPTDIYSHGVLGDPLEASVLRLVVDGRDVEIPAGEGAVFEDLRPRLADIDGDGREEVAVVRTRVDQGAAFAIFTADGELFAETAPIGTAFRWLNPVGLADLDDDGVVEAAWVVRPHLDATLTVASVRSGEFETLDELPGHSNHSIGSTAIGQSIVSNGLLAVPKDSHRRLAFYKLGEGQLNEVEAWDLEGTLTTEIHRVGDVLVFGVEGAAGDVLWTAPAPELL